MTDEEVGELWRGIVTAKDIARYYHYPVTHEVNQKEQLIRKLVDERARCHYGCYEPIAIENALRDFGIDPKEWKE